MTTFVLGAHELVAHGLLQVYMKTFTASVRWAVPYPTYANVSSTESSSPISFHLEWPRVLQIPTQAACSRRCFFQQPNFEPVIRPEIKTFLESKLKHHLHPDQVHKEGRNLHLPAISTTTSSRNPPLTSHHRPTQSPPYASITVAASPAPKHLTRTLQSPLPPIPLPSNIRQTGARTLTESIAEKPSMVASAATTGRR